MFDKIIELLQENSGTHDIWTDGDEIICSSLERANVIADLLEDCGYEGVATGTYDNEETEFYVRID